jgi:hypothetical protein
MPHTQELKNTENFETVLEVIAVMSLRITRLSSHFFYMTSNYQGTPTLRQWRGTDWVVWVLNGGQGGRKHFAAETEGEKGGGCASQCDGKACQTLHAYMSKERMTW